MINMDTLTLLGNECDYKITMSDPNLGQLGVIPILVSFGNTIGLV